MSTFRRKPLSRRTFLRGCVAGTTVALGLPMLEAMLSGGRAVSAAADQQPFFGVFYWANGLPWHAEHGAEQASAGHADHWTPAQQGAGYTPSPLLEPLARHQVNVATGLQPHTEIPPQPPGQGDGHMRGFMVALTGDRPRSMGFNHSAHALTSRRETIDQFVARHPDFYPEGEAPLYRSIEVGVSAARFHTYGHWNAISYNGPGSLNLPIMAATTLFDRLFGVQHRGENQSRRRELLLDAVLEDARSLEGKLGHADQMRLEAHLEHIRSLERRLEGEMTQCATPARPSNGGDLLDRAEVMAELLVTAISCGLTRVFSFMLTSPASTHIFSNLGVPDGMHKTCHDGHWQRVYDITHYQMRAFARVLDTFDVELPDGSSLLDHGVILGTSEYGEGWKHSVREFPAVLTGGGGGRLAHGVHTREPGGNLSKIHLTALRALGLDVSSFGWSGGQTSEPVSGFLA